MALALTPFSHLADGTDEFLVATGNHRLYGYYVSNANAAIRYVKLYDKATAPDENDTPVVRIMVPAGGAANVMSESGIEFLLGIGCRIVTTAADTGDTGVTSTESIVNLWYR